MDKDEPREEVVAVLKLARFGIRQTRLNQWTFSKEIVEKMWVLLKGEDDE